MSNNKVMVLIPNGRRQNVAVTPNTTILQILEEVCRKHEFNVNEYDLMHFNNRLDPGAILRFTRLANNAQLEMVPCTKKRSVSAVDIGIQLENGERLMGKYTPDATLVEILQNVKLNEDLERVALIYMHQEISGEEALKNTTLKSLGLNNGGAILRLIHKNLQTVHTVTSTLEAEKTNKDAKKIKRNSGKKHSLITDSSKKGNITSTEKIQTSKETCSQNIEEKTKNIIEKEQTNTIASTSRDDSVENRILTQPHNKCEIDDLNNIEFLGARNALVFNKAAIEGIIREDLPDEFYDFTVDDAKIFYRDIKRYEDELEEAPLLTNVQRQLNEEKWKSNQLEKYHDTIIRIHFPDQFVLQGLFHPMETVQAIKDFIKSYLTDANNDFVIFTAPPKHILKPEAHLIDENLISCAIVYYSGPSALKPDIKEKFTDPRKVQLQVAKVRSSKKKEILNEDAKVNDATKSKPVCSSKTKNEPSSEKKDKIPKWFNPSLK